MAKQKEAELVRAVIVYCQRCQEEGDIPALREMGFGPRELTALESLTAADMLILASTQSHFLNITIDPEIYWRMIDYISREHTRQELIDFMIRNEAPLPMMYALTGMGSKEFAFNRRKLGMESARVGRPESPSQEVTDRVWNAVGAVLGASNRLGPMEFLKIYESLEFEVSLRAIWHLTKQWDRDGTLEKQHGQKNLA